MRAVALVISLATAALGAGCQRTDSDSKSLTAVGSGSAGMSKVRAGSGSGGSGATVPPTRHVEQIAPPLDLKAPPADALKSTSGLLYKKLVTNAEGTPIGRNDSVMINSTTWKPSTGETIATNKTRGQPLPFSLATAAPGFAELMQLLRKGEKAVVWVPPGVPFRAQPQPAPETMVYEIEVVDVTPAPAIPPDVKEPPAKAQAFKSGIKYEIVRPGTGADKARAWDTVTFNFSAWDGDGHMFDTTETRKRPASAPPYRQSAVMQEVLTSVTAGTRVRFWVDSEKMMQGGRATPGMPKGLLCYELELLQIAKAPNDPPPAPADVAKPPADAKKTEKGVFYKVEKAGAGGPHPKPSDVVKVNYTGWTTDGRMFDSSLLRAQPAEFSLMGVIAGWTDGIPMMSVGDKFRFWIPEELAYKGAPNRPQGMLVFDVELLEIKDGATKQQPQVP
jgi:peptidylprolyl isomerase